MKKKRKINSRIHLSKKTVEEYFAQFPIGREALEERNRALEETVKACAECFSDETITEEEFNRLKNPFE
jgi:hypothetical protein